MSELMLLMKILFLVKNYIRKCNVSDLMIHTKMCNVQIYVTHENEMCSIPNLCYMRKCNMSEHKLHTKRCFVSKMCNVRTYVTHGNMMSGV